MPEVTAIVNPLGTIGTYFNPITLSERSYGLTYMVILIGGCSFLNGQITPRFRDASLVVYYL